MKKILAILLALGLILSFTACSGDDPEGVVEDFMDALQEADYSEMAGYTTDSSFVDDTENMIETVGQGMGMNSSQAERLTGIMWTAMSYDITDSEVDGDEATVMVEVLMPDGIDLDDSTIAKSNSLSIDERWAYLEENIDDIVILDEVTWKFKLEKVDGEWKITDVIQ